MKKFSVILILCALFLCACQQSNPIPPVIQETDQRTSPTEEQQHESQTEIQSEIQTEIQTEPQTEIQTEPETAPESEISTEPQTESESDLSNDPQPELDHSILFKSVDALMEGLWERHIAQSGDAGTNGGTTSITMVCPVLKKTDMRFAYIDIVPDDRVEFVFCPINSRIAELDERAVVNVYFADLYSGRYANVPRNEDGSFYVYGEWWYKIGGHTVSVQVPLKEWDDETSMYPYEKVAEYFDFEIVTYSPTAETNPVQ